MEPRPILTPDQFVRARLCKKLNNPKFPIATVRVMDRIAEAVLDAEEMESLADDGSGVASAADHTVTCPDCHGTGKRIFAFTIEYPCRQCGGSGRVSELVIRQRERQAAS